MALGDGFGQLIRPTGVSPIASAPTVVRDVLGDVLTGLASEVERRVKPIAIDQAAQQGRVDGDAGINQKVASFTDVGQAYVSANRQAYLARVNTDRDETLEDLSLIHQADPKGFEDAANEARSKAIQGAGREYAVQIEQGYDRGIKRRLTRIARQRQSLDLTESKASIDARMTTLKSQIEGFASNGELASEESIYAMIDLANLRNEKVDNPLFTYSADQALQESAKFSRRVASLAIGREAEIYFEAAITAKKSATLAFAETRAKLARDLDVHPVMPAL